MNVHEYQAKKLLREYGVPVPEGEVAFTPDEAYAAAEKLGGTVVVKSQIHAGGRGKAGGILMAKDAEEAKARAQELLGKTLYTKQTGPAGKTVHRLYIEKATDDAKELYLGFTIDNVAESVAIIASEEGGMDIEDVAENHPEKIITTHIDPAYGLRTYQAYELADGINLPEELKPSFISIVKALAKLVTEKECNLFEINPLAITADGKLLALDAKADFDSSALFRHKDIDELRDRSEETPLEARAFDLELNYVSLDGNIGCFVIGAGMAMATMDCIKYYGGEPANFLDCGGANTSPEVSKKAFEIVLDEKGVEGVLVNIFGGIVQTDLVAEGLIMAIREMKKPMPIVIRMEGFNADRANQLFRESGLDVHLANSLTEGVQMIMKLVNEKEA